MRYGEIERLLGVFAVYRLFGGGCVFVCTGAHRVPLESLTI